MKRTKMSLSCFWKENISECLSYKLHLFRRGQLHHCGQKIAFSFLDLKIRKELIFFSVSFQTDVVLFRFIPPLVAWDKLSKIIEDHFASPFLRVKSFHSYQTATSFVFSFLVFLFFLSILLQSKLPLFFQELTFKSS